MAVVRTLAFLILAACGACAAPVKELTSHNEAEPVTSIYLVSHGWHVGIVLKRADIPDGVWQSQRDFPDAEYLEVSWGDGDFYQASDPDPGDFLKAALLPTASVLHVIGFSGSVPAHYHYRYSEIIEIRLSAADMQRLTGYIAASFLRDGAGNTRSPGPDLYRNRRFYLSNETYHLLNTCNVWVARALRTAGLPITPANAITADGLMSQAREIGKVVRSSPRDS